jgi:hypothetical protein
MRKTASTPDQNQVLRGLRQEVSLREPLPALWWQKGPGADALSGLCSVNALTSRRLTDRWGGSTFYDSPVGMRSENR